MDSEEFEMIVENVGLVRIHNFFYRTIANCMPFFTVSLSTEYVNF